jgi:hypothetical protein
MMQTFAAVPRLDSVESLEDNCDSCGVPAKLRFELAAGGTLAFCGHHANRSVDDIVRLATQVVLESGYDWRGVGHQIG